MATENTNAKVKDIVLDALARFKIRQDNANNNKYSLKSKTLTYTIGTSAPTVAGFWFDTTNYR